MNLEPRFHLHRHLKLNLVFLCVSSPLTLAASPPTNSSETCPMDLNYVLIIPWNTSLCRNFHPTSDPSKDLRCISLLSLFGVALAQRLKETSLFQLPDLPTAVSCLQDYQSKLTALSLSSNLVSDCFEPLQFVITPNICAHIESTRDWVAQLGESITLDSACKPDLIPPTYSI